ncbi:MAG: bacterial regulatory Fis family protein [Phage 65_10]|nr:MAG: bacterial regulatory Fis family protein [Phage 65_10]
MTNKTDLVDRIFNLLKPPMTEKELDQAKAALREEFGGQPGVFKRSTAERKSLARQILARFNGRNATELARELQISRATVYRWLKQPGVR